MWQAMPHRMASDMPRSFFGVTKGGQAAFRTPLQKANCGLAAVLQMCCLLNRACAWARVRRYAR